MSAMSAETCMLVEAYKGTWVMCEKEPVFFVAWILLNPHVDLMSAILIVVLLSGDSTCQHHD